MRGVSLRIAVLITFGASACSSKNSSAPAAESPVSQVQIQSQEKIGIAPVGPGVDCSLGGIRTRAWTEQGGNAEAFDDNTDKLLLEKVFCNTANNTFAVIKSNAVDCSSNGQTDCTTTASFKAAAVKNLTSWSIREGKTLFGVTGQANFLSLVSIGAPHDQSSPAISYAQQLYLGFATKPWRLLTAGPGAGYREVPKILGDDDGESGIDNHVKPVIRGIEEWNIGVPRRVCGVASTSHAGKVKDCAIRHKIRPIWDAGIEGQITWNGSLRGTNSEGSWTLVTIYAQGKNDGDLCTSQCFEVWRDDRTGMVWSDTIKNNTYEYFNWCHASGSNFSSNTSNPYREDDPVNICDNSTYQNQTQDPKPISLCFEDSDWLQTPEMYSPMKGNMHKGAGASARVKWRLPTRSDWILAEHNGFRHVLPNTSKIFWSATISSLFMNSSMEGAWTVGALDGDFEQSTRSKVNGVRCIGSPDLSHSPPALPSTNSKGSFLTTSAETSFELEMNEEPQGLNCPRGGLLISLKRGASATKTTPTIVTTKALCKTEQDSSVVLQYSPEKCTRDGQTTCIATTDFAAYSATSIEPFDLVLGSSFAGVRGAAFAGQFISSGASRNKNAQAMTYADEIYTHGVNTLFRNISSGAGAGSREVPKINLDGDFSLDGTVPHPAAIVRANNATWNTGVQKYVCGKSATTISGKITDCAAKHTSKPAWDANMTGRISWDGTKSGTNSEGRWTLVTIYHASLADGAACPTTYSDATGCHEVWRDDRTGMLWSDMLHLPNSTASNTSPMLFNWCVANGVHTGSNPAHPYRSDDPFSICNNNTLQNQTTPASLCFEDASWLNTPTNTLSAKGNMHSMSGASVKVKWRLPSRRDWEIADFNGLGMVLPRMTETFWSSTLESTERRAAWIYFGPSGGVLAAERNGSNQVRCVGVSEPENGN